MDIQAWKEEKFRQIYKCRDSKLVYVREYDGLIWNYCTIRMVANFLFAFTQVNLPELAVFRSFIYNTIKFRLN